MLYLRYKASLMMIRKLEQKNETSICSDFDGMQAFTTARKAVEFVQRNFTGWDTVLDADDWMHGKEKPVETFPTAKLITRLNKHGHLMLSDGSDTTSVERVWVR